MSILFFYSSFISPCFVKTKFGLKTDAYAHICKSQIVNSSITITAEVSKPEEDRISPGGIKDKHHASVYPKVLEELEPTII